MVKQAFPGSGNLKAEDKELREMQKKIRDLQEENWLYLASVMDLYSRKIVGFQMGARMTKELVISALDQAYNLRKPGKGLTHHSDRGSQYASHDYQARLKRYHMIGSMSNKGDCYDNACI